MNPTMQYWAASSSLMNAVCNFRDPYEIDIMSLSFGDEFSTFKADNLIEHLYAIFDSSNAASTDRRRPDILRYV